MNVEYQYQGVGRNLQKDLLVQWYDQLSKANEKKQPVCYLFISGNIAELLRVFDFQLVYPEVNALQCGVKKVAGDFILKAEDRGYSPDVCGYVKNDIGLIESDNVSPFGKLPRPDLLLCSFSGCNTYIKWFEALSRIYDCPLFMLDIPFLRTGRAEPNDIEYILAQFRDLIAVCEKITGKTYDEDKLKEILKLAGEAEDLWVNILNSAALKPSPFDAFFEAVFFMAPIYVLRGTQECVDYYRQAWNEITERIQLGVSAAPDEKFRLILEGPPPWPHFRTFWELFKKWNVCFVASTYSKVGGIWDMPGTSFFSDGNPLRHHAEQPLRSIAEYSLNCYTNYNLEMRRNMLLHYYRRFSADGVVFHSVKSCRVFSVGQADTREMFTRDLGIPTLFLESDLADPRYFAEAQMRNRIDAFFESLELKR